MLRKKSRSLMFSNLQTKLAIEIREYCVWRQITFPLPEIFTKSALWKRTYGKSACSYSYN